jgi:glycosyltransferase involved in cell wall biosynthesis
MLKKLGAQKAHTINNGFEKLLHLPDPTHSKFRIVHIGLINSLRNPMEFWHVLEEMLLENEEFYQCLEIELYGVVSDQVKHEINKLRNLRDRVQYPGYLTQEDIPEAMQNASVLLVIQNRSSNNRWIIPYKLYEYMPAKRPILQLGGAEGDSNDIILEHQLGLAIDGNNKVALKRALHQLFENWQNKHYTNQSVGIDTFLHENLVKKVAALLD